MIKRAAVEAYLLSLDGVKMEHPYGKKVDVFVNGQGEMFALVEKDTDPVSLSLRCDRKLALLLRERYESVMQGKNLNKKDWNTIILTGQLSWEEIQDLIRHAYHLVGA